MRIIIVSLFALYLIQPVLAQPPSKTQKPVKNEMQTQMLEAVNEINKQIADLEKQIAEAKKNKEDEETIKDLEDQLAMLKKQAAMMGGVKKSLSGISEKTFQQAGEEEAILPKKDSTLNSKISKKILTDAELSLFTENVHAQVEKLIPAAERTEALKIYNEAKAKYKSPNALGSAASSCWMYGHQEKALWITGKACINYPGNADNLSNYAAFLIMTGAEHTAIPILLYLNNKFPDNSTILNNLGQAWFGLGDIASSRKYLEKVTELYLTHSMANLTLSKIYLAQLDTLRAISALKKSISESFCADKESMLTGVGGALTLDDLPEFDYPVEKDPFGFESLFQAIPDFQASLDDWVNSDALWRGYDTAMKVASEKAQIEAEAAGREQSVFTKKMVENISFQRRILYTYSNSPSHALASRYLLAVATEEVSDIQSSLLHSIKTLHPLSMILSSNLLIAPAPPRKKPISVIGIIRTLNKLTDNELIKPIAALETERNNRIKSINTQDPQKRCVQVDAINTEFLNRAKSIELLFKGKFYQKYLELKSPFDVFIALSGYSAKRGTIADDPADRTIDNYFNDIEPWLSGNPYIHRIQSGTFMKSWEQLTSYRVSVDRCSKVSIQKPPERVNLPATKQPDCPNRTVFKLFGAQIAFGWGRMICDESKLKKLSSGETKGSAISSKQQPSNSPVSLNDILGRGPLINAEEKKQDYYFYGPLVTGISNKNDTTQRYIEFDKYGNFSDFRIPLNKDGTGFADSYLSETFDQRRWCWVACPSGREKKLAGLLKPQ